MTIDDEIKNMYSKRLERKEIKREISDSTIYQHRNNITKIHQAITGNIPELFAVMVWLEEKTAEEIFEVIKTLPGRKESKLGIAAQRQYLTSVLVAIRVYDFYRGQDTQLFKDISDLLQMPLKKEMDTYRDKLKEETKETLPDYKEIMKIVKNYIDTADHTHLDMKILLRIYTIYPIRLEAADLIYIQDHNLYRKMKKKELTKNYVVVGKKKVLFSFSDYKTSVKYGTVEIVVKDKLLKNLLQQKAVLATNQESMFNISRNTMSKNITTFFEKQGLKNISPTTLAKVIETNAYNSIPEAERSKMKTLAEFRRHSLDTQSKFYIH
tara:strand:- start:2436 stop:3407 length:972 start_codon:yes stop_codon:yes gene_type:complete